MITASTRYESPDARADGWPPSPMRVVSGKEIVRVAEEDENPKPKPKHARYVIRSCSTRKENRYLRRIFGGLMLEPQTRIRASCNRVAALQATNSCLDGAEDTVKEKPSPHPHHLQGAINVAVPSRPLVPNVETKQTRLEHGLTKRHPTAFPEKRSDRRGQWQA